MYEADDMRYTEAIEYAAALARMNRAAMRLVNEVPQRVQARAGKPPEVGTAAVVALPGSTAAQFEEKPNAPNLRERIRETARNKTVTRGIAREESREEVSNRARIDSCKECACSRLAGLLVRAGL